MKHRICYSLDHLTHLEWLGFVVAGGTTKAQDRHVGGGRRNAQEHEATGAVRCHSCLLSDQTALLIAPSDQTALSITPSDHASELHRRPFNSPLMCQKKGAPAVLGAQVGLLTDGPLSRPLGRPGDDWGGLGACGPTDEFRGLLTGIEPSEVPRGHAHWA